jgi:hypothetical protein
MTQPCAPQLRNPVGSMSELLCPDDGRRLKLRSLRFSFQVSGNADLRARDRNGYAGARDETLAVHGAGGLRNGGGRHGVRSRLQGRRLSGLAHALAPRRTGNTLRGRKFLGLFPSHRSRTCVLALGRCVTIEVRRIAAPGAGSAAAARLCCRYEQSDSCETGDSDCHSGSGDCHPDRLHGCLHVRGNEACITDPDTDANRRAPLFRPEHGCSLR